jgi:hypothetical protein
MDRPADVMGGWGGDWQVIGPGINNAPVHVDGIGDWMPALSIVIADLLPTQAGVSGLGLGLGLELDGCGGEGGLGVGVGVGAEGRLTPTRQVCFTHYQTQVQEPPSPPPTANPNSIPPPLHNHSRTVPPFGVPASGRAPWVPIAPTLHTPMGDTPAFAFAVPDLQVEELPDTWSSPSHATQYAVLASPVVTHPTQAQGEIPLFPTPASDWPYTPPATRHSARPFNGTYATQAPHSCRPMSDSAAVPVDASDGPPPSSQGDATAVEPGHGSEASPSLPVPMTTSPAFSDSLSSPRIETPRDSCQLDDAEFEMDGRATCQTELSGTDLR